MRAIATAARILHQSDIAIFLIMHFIADILVLSVLIMDLTNMDLI